MRVERTCTGCGAGFTANIGTRNKGLYCSRQCAFSHKATAWNLGRRSKPEQSLITYAHCAECAQVFAKRQRSHKSVCSAKCFNSRANRSAAEYQRRTRNLTHPRKEHVATCQNVRCSAIFSQHVRTGQPRQKFCSHRCARSVASHAYGKRHQDRARKFGVPFTAGVTAIKVFERDGWRCQLCGCSTPKRLRGTYKPNAPEVDHIIPMSLGGGHTWANVQCSCRKCNADKSAKPLGQLRLAV